MCFYPVRCRALKGDGLTPPRLDDQTTLIALGRMGEDHYAITLRHKRRLGGLTDYPSFYR